MSTFCLQYEKNTHRERRKFTIYSGYGEELKVLKLGNINKERRVSYEYLRNHEIVMTILNRICRENSMKKNHTHIHINSIDNLLLPLRKQWIGGEKKRSMITTLFVVSITTLTHYR